MKNEEEIPLRITQETPYQLNVALAVGERYVYIDDGLYNS